MAAKLRPAVKRLKRRTAKIALKHKTIAPARKKASIKRPKRATTNVPSQPSTSLVSKGAEDAGAPWSPAAGEVGVRVRMYRVGFGDFFLITFLADASGPVHIIVDCGVFKGTSQTGDIGSIGAAVSDMVQTTGGRVALIIMTHRHADHIAGFARYSDIFKKLTVGGVWMPIWESEYEPIALKFQAELTRTALALRQHFSALGGGGTEEQNTARKYMENATGDLAVAKGSNAAALDLLKHGFSGVTPDYYKGGDEASLPQPLVDAGVTAKILGPPPVDDLDLMKLMDLQKNVGQYLTSDGGDDPSLFTPFATKWVVNPNSPQKQRLDSFYLPVCFREWVRPRKSYEPVTQEEAKRARGVMESVLQASQPIAALTAAKQLNSFLNNQSLVVLFGFKGKKLLFVGDAQAGNWEHWLFDTDSPDKTASGTMAPLASQILSNLDFYKVGHHGSGNATPKAAAEAMGSNRQKFAAMCSTQADVYGTEDPDDPSKGTEVPRIPLLQKLASEAALVRSDQIDITFDGEGEKSAVSAAWPATAPGMRFEKGAIWVDCFL